MKIERVLIYRLGSLGDSVIALPAIHLIARSFPSSERRVLTNFPLIEKAFPINTILKGSGLAQGYMSYPLGLRNTQQLFDLRKQIRQWMPDVLVYLAAARGRSKAFRDALFFRSCGIKKIIGVPYSKELQENQWLEDKLCYEHEAKRIDRCLVSIGDTQIDKPESWDLCLSTYERERACYELRFLFPNYRFIACSVGTKVLVNDWGQNNWKTLINQLSYMYKNYGLVLIGSKDEFSYSENVSSFWTGPKRNLCGLLTPRESAAVLELSTIFIGHDSGPIHLAASVGTPCVGIYSARNKPGVWFPYGTKHRVIYHQTDCYGCGVDVCKIEKKRCINSIPPNEVVENISDLIGKRISD